MNRLSMALSSHHKKLVLVFAVSFALSIAYSFYHRIEPVVDARSYDAIAQNIVSGEGFKEDRTLSYEFDPSIIRAGPLYEYFLAGVYALFGHSYPAVWVLQALLHVLSAYLVYRISRELFTEHSETIGLVSAMLIGFHPDLIEISAMLMTETLYLFLVTLTLLAFLKAYQKPEALSRALFLGGSTALSILIRPPVLFFIPIFLFLFVAKKQYRSVGVFLAVVCLCMLPWTVRNYTVYRQFIPTTLIGQYNLWVGNTLLAGGGQLAGGVNPAIAYLEGSGASRFAHEAGKEFRSFVFGHPLVFLKLTVIRIVRYVSLIRPMGFWFYQAGLPQLIFVALSGLSIALLFISGVAGLWRYIREQKELGYYLLALTLTAPLPLIITVVQSRYRFQVYPFLAVPGAYFLVALCHRAEGVRRIGLITAGILLTISLIDVSMFLPVVLERLGRFL